MTNAEQEVNIRSVVKLNKTDAETLNTLRDVYEEDGRDSYITVTKWLQGMIRQLEGCI